jgi:DNA phosphorothioation-dependent restriction protein DptG
MVSPLPSIVTLAQAKAAAKITTSEDDQILYAYLETAHEWVLDHLNNQIDDSSDEWIDTILAWDESNAPKRVIGAILHTFIYLQRFRGDDDAKIQPAATASGLPLIAEMMLGRLRDPTLA